MVGHGGGVGSLWRWSRLLCAANVGPHRGAELTIRPPHLEALGVGTLTGDGDTALYLKGTLVGSGRLRFRRHYGGDALHMLMAEAIVPRPRAF